MIILEKAYNAIIIFSFLKKATHNIFSFNFLIVIPQGKFRLTGKSRRFGRFSY